MKKIIYYIGIYHICLGIHEGLEFLHEEIRKCNQNEKRQKKGAIGAIEGGTRAFIESATGIRKKRREELFRREKELDSKLEKLKLDVTADLEKQAKEAFEETAHNIEQAKDTQSEIEELLRELDK